MTISEMHELFRTLGQQMGMQTIRGVLPVEIDKFLNLAIITKVRSILAENASVDYKNLIAIQNKGVSPINALRTLYCEEDNNATNNVMVYLGVSVNYSAGGAKHKCRIIDNVELERVLDDYCSAPSEEEPVVTIKGSTITVYPSTGVVTKTIKYIKEPDIVHLDSASASCVDCNLPSYLHDEIVVIAVNKFFDSVGYTTHSVKKNETNK